MEACLELTGRKIFCGGVMPRGSRGESSASRRGENLRGKKQAGPAEKGRVCRAEKGRPGGRKKMVCRERNRRRVSTE